MSRDIDEQIDIDEQNELIRLLKQAIEYPSPSSAAPNSEPICIVCPDNAKAILTSLRELKRIKELLREPPVTMIEELAKDMCQHEYVGRSFDEFISPGRELWMRLVPEAETSIKLVSAALLVEVEKEMNDGK